jgi:hypothetical protein
MGLAVAADLVALALIVGLIVAGMFLIQSMTSSRSILRVRAAALVSIVLMVLLMYWMSRGD